MVAEIIEIKKNGIVQYPITKQECVLNNEGKTITQVLNDLQNTYATKDYVDGQVGQGTGNTSIKVDSALSADSSNPVQNKVITEVLSSKLESEEVSEMGPTEDVPIQGGESSITASLETLSNGNIRVTINGTSEDFMSATPSGDPMHYVYVAVGAAYNETDKDIPMVGVYGDSYLHRAKHWHLNELGDITNEEMREIYLFANMDNSVKNCAQLMQGITTRTNIATWSGAWNNKIKDAQLFGFAEVINVILRRNDVHYTDTNTSYMFTTCRKLEKVFPIIDATSTTSFNGVFSGCNNLREVRIKNVKVPIKFNDSPLISSASIFYLIKNSAATSNIIITLHADALANAEAAYLVDAEQDLVTYPTLTKLALSKNIQLATA